MEDGFTFRRSMLESVSTLRAVELHRGKRGELSGRISSTLEQSTDAGEIVVFDKTRPYANTVTCGSSDRDAAKQSGVIATSMDGTGVGAIRTI